MKAWGVVLLVVGLGVAAISFLLPVSVDSYSSSAYVPDKIINIGKLQVQMLAFQSGAALFLAGSVFTAIGALLERFDSLQLAGAELAGDPAGPTAPEEAPPPIVVEETEQEREERLERLAEEQKRENRLMWMVIGVVFVGFALAVFASMINKQPSAEVTNTSEVVPVENVAAQPIRPGTADAYEQAAEAPPEDEKRK